MRAGELPTLPRTEKHIFTKVMDEKMLAGFVEVNKGLITAEVVALASGFEVEPNTLLTGHLVYEIKSD